MNQMKNSKFDETYLLETLENGLRVVVVHKPEYAKSHFLFLTPFGAIHSNMLDDENQKVTFTDGLAHFLEHKMFESEQGDVLSQFSSMGISANAFTSYTETAYYFSTTMEIKEPLELLLDFVQKLEIDEVSVEKEKGIIVQELKMYQQMSDVRFVQEMFSSLYHIHPLKNDIGGSVQSVNAITLAELETCYAINYHPQNMVLVCVSGQDSKEILTFVQQNQAKKTFPEVSKVHKFKYDEPKEVVRETYTFEMDVNQPIYGIAIKMQGVEDVSKRFMQDMALKILLEGTFSSSGKYVQTWLDQRLINDSFNYDSDIGEDYGFILLYSETDSVEKLDEEFRRVLALMKEQLISEESLQSIKRKLLGYYIRSMNRFEEYAISYARSMFQGLDYFTMIEEIGNLTMQDVREVAMSIELGYSARVLLKSKNKKSKS